MMGERRVIQEAAHSTASSLGMSPMIILLRKVDQFVDLSEVRAHLGPYYSDDRAALDRSRTDDAHTDRCTTTSTFVQSVAYVERSISVWPIAGFVRLGLDADVPDHSTFLKPPQPLPRERSVAQGIRDGGGALHEGRDRGRRGLCSRRQHNSCRCASKAKCRQGQGP